MVQNASLYRAFGVDFQSALVLPEMRVGTGQVDTPVVIERERAGRPADGSEIAAGVATTPSVFWMDVPDVARLRVEDGQRMIVELAGGATESDARAYLLGSALGALLHQRGLLPLHASAVEIDGKAYAFVGQSGAGKSTLALALTERGHRLLCDDIVAIDTSGPVPVCWPGLVNVKVWGATLAAAGHRSDGLEQVLPTLDKYRLPVTALAEYRAVLLGGVFALAVGTEAVIAPIRGSDAAALLIANTFRGQLVGPMQRQRAHFDQCVAVASQVSVERLERSWNLKRIDDCCALIERHATK